MNFVKQQINLLEKVNDYIIKNKKKGINTGYSSLCYFSSWTFNPGYGRLKFWIDGYVFIFKYLYVILRDFLAISKYHSYCLINNEDKNIKYKKIIISFSTKEAFKSDGSYIDRLFNINSNINYN